MIHPWIADVCQASNWSGEEREGGQGGGGVKTERERGTGKGGGADGERERNRAWRGGGARERMRWREGERRREGGKEGETVGQYYQPFCPAGLRTR